VTLIPESGESTERESVGSTGSKTVTFDDEMMSLDSSSFSPTSLHQQALPHDYPPSKTAPPVERLLMGPAVAKYVF
jgi:hypothetical protein